MTNLSMLAQCYLMCLSYDQLIHAGTVLSKKKLDRLDPAA